MLCSLAPLYLFGGRSPKEGLNAVVKCLRRATYPRIEAPYSKVLHPIPNLLLEYHTAIEANPLVHD